MAACKCVPICFAQVVLCENPGLFVSINAGSKGSSLNLRRAAGWISCVPKNVAMTVYICLEQSAKKTEMMYAVCIQPLTVVVVVVTATHKHVSNASRASYSVASSDLA
ncbi:DUF2888 domain-containing protein [Pseudomonas aeruginosa]|nr:DUF2888 domain-containing protein [Pseudomonas aeruginosa]